MLRDFLQALGIVATPRDSVQVWDCDPLVVVDDDGSLAFSGRCDVEFSPGPENGVSGRAEAQRSREGWTPTLNVVSRIDDPVIDMRMGQRGGFTLRGADDEGYGFRWYVNRAAVRYLTELRQHEILPQDGETGVS